MARFTAKLLSNSTGGMMLRVAGVLVLLLVTPLALAADRVISLGGSVTEIIYALGEGERLVADDASSLYPPAATELPRVGYYRQLSVEGILSERPDLLIASENAGPPDVLQRLQSMGVAVTTVSDQPGLDSLMERVAQVAGALGVAPEGERLERGIRDALQQAVGSDAVQRRTLIVLHRGGPLMSAGADTSADALLRLAGLENAASETRGYRPISEESLVALAPDMIITTTMSAESAGGLDAFLHRPGVAATPAGKEGRVIAVDDLLLLGMGPRVAEAVSRLRQASR